MRASPKSGIRNPRETRNSKTEKLVRSGDSDLGILSDFEFGISDFTLWQLVDSAFPTGGFAHSAGLEAAWQNGEVKNRGEIISFVEASLHQLGNAPLPFVIAAHTVPKRLDEFDNLCDAFTTNHVANRASRAQGKAFLSAVQRVFAAGREMPVLKFNHFPCIFGGAMRVLDNPSKT